MYRLMPFRRHGRESFFPQSFQQLFSWPEFSWQGWQGFNVDVKETADGYSLQADLPGVARRTLSCPSMTGISPWQCARMRSRRKTATATSAVREGRCPVSAASMGNISPEDVQASYRDGVLDVRFPKAADGPSNREIPIQ